MRRVHHLWLIKLSRHETLSSLHEHSPGAEFKWWMSPWWMSPWWMRPWWMRPWWTSPWWMSPWWMSPRWMSPWWMSAEVCDSFPLCCRKDFSSRFPASFVSRTAHSVTVRVLHSSIKENCTIQRSRGRLQTYFSFTYEWKYDVFQCK